MNRYDTGKFWGSCRYRQGRKLSIKKSQPGFIQNMWLSKWDSNIIGLIIILREWLYMDEKQKRGRLLSTFYTPSKEPIGKVFIMRGRRVLCNKILEVE